LLNLEETYRHKIDRSLISRSVTIHLNFERRVSFKNFYFLSDKQLVVLAQSIFIPSTPGNISVPQGKSNNRKCTDAVIWRALFSSRWDNRVVIVVVVVVIVTNECSDFCASRYSPRGTRLIVYSTKRGKLGNYVSKLRGQFCFRCTLALNSHG